MYYMYRKVVEWRVVKMFEVLLEVFIMCTWVRIAGVQSYGVIMLVICPF